jgi:DNA polymerase III sliding clamp (beta) subunit (PCNA family)
MISRQRLLRKVQQIAPAIASDDLVPILRHVLFTGTHLVAYNERIALSVPLRTDFTGTIPGHLLIDMLKISSSSTVEMVRNGNGVQLGGTSFEAREVADYVFRMPPPRDKFIPVGAQFFDAVAKCLQTVSEHSVTNDHLGITLIPGDGQQLKMFSTRNAAMTCCTVDLPQRLVRKRVILPIDSCKQMLRLAKHAQTTRLAFHDDHYALFLADDTLLFGKLVKSNNPFQFERLLERLMPNGTRSEMVPIPKPKFGIMLQQAARICDIKGNEVRTRFTVREGVIELFSRSDRGQVSESIPLPGHPDVEQMAQAAYVLPPYKWAERMLISEDCVLLASGNAVAFVACYDPS